MNTHYLNGLPQEWTAIAEVFSALGDGTRQTILLLFEPGESIEPENLRGHLAAEPFGVVHHLKVLGAGGIVDPHKHGRALSYTLNLACAVHALGQVKTYADELLAATEAAQ